MRYRGIRKSRSGDLASLGLVWSSVLSGDPILDASKPEEFWPRITNLLNSTGKGTFLPQLAVLLQEKLPAEISTKYANARVDHDIKPPVTKIVRPRMCYTLFPVMILMVFVVITSIPFFYRSC